METKTCQSDIRLSKDRFEENVAKDLVDKLGFEFRMRDEKSWEQIQSRGWRKSVITCVHFDRFICVARDKLLSSKALVLSRRICSSIKFTYYHKIDLVTNSRFSKPTNSVGFHTGDQCLNAFSGKIIDWVTLVLLSYTLPPTFVGYHSRSRLWTAGFWDKWITDTLDQKAQIISGPEASQ